VPPWKIGRPGLVSGYTRLLADAGYDVWLVCPPRHLERTPAGVRSGEGFVSLDLACLRATFEQLVVELRFCAAWAARRGKVGLVGLSLGGLAGAFAASAPERLEFAALVAPAHLSVMTETGIGRRYRRLATLDGSTWPDEDALSAALAPFDPALRAPTARRLFIAGGVHDRIVTNAGPSALARAWGLAPRLYPRGHISLLFLCRALRRDLEEFARG
jgi:pimeloyl-ACP methyl ester carboxylesterase